MPGFYSKVVARIEVGTTGANVNDFVSKAQVEKRLNELETMRLNAQNAINFIENEERILRTLLKDIKY